MAYQMIYTSVRSGLVAGRSGFCTAARHKEIKESLVARIEDFANQYDRSLLSKAGGEMPVIYSHRIVKIRENVHHVLMRVSDAGNDYSGRTNHIAHAVVLDRNEVSQLSISPAEAIMFLREKSIWQSRYEGPAQYFGDDRRIDLQNVSPGLALPASHWAEKTGRAANAAHLFGGEEPRETMIAVSSGGEPGAAEILPLIGESLLLLSPGRSSGTALWSVTFTTILQARAERSQFRWSGAMQETAIFEQEQKAGHFILDPTTALKPPAGQLADIAEGREPVRELQEPSATADVLQPEAVNMGSATMPQTTPNAIPGAERQVPSPAPPPPGPPAYDSVPVIDPELARPSRGRGPILFASLAVTVVVASMVGFLIVHISQSKRKNAEKEIAALINEGQWTQAKKRLEVAASNDQTSPSLTEFGKVIAAGQTFALIGKYPHWPREELQRKELVSNDFGEAEEARTKLNRTWESWENDLKNYEIDSKHEDLAGRVANEKTKASAEIEKWQKELTRLDELWKALAGAQGSPLPQRTQQEIEQLQSKYYSRERQYYESLGKELSDLKQFQKLYTEINRFETPENRPKDEQGLAKAKERIREIEGKLEEIDERTTSAHATELIAGLCDKAVKLADTLVISKPEPATENNTGEDGVPADSNTTETSTGPKIHLWDWNQPFLIESIPNISFSQEFHFQKNGEEKHYKGSYVKGIKKIYPKGLQTKDCIISVEDDTLTIDRTMRDDNPMGFSLLFGDKTKPHTVIQAFDPKNNVSLISDPASRFLSLKNGKVAPNEDGKNELSRFALSGGEFVLKLVPEFGNPRETRSQTIEELTLDLVAFANAAADEIRKINEREETVEKMKQFIPLGSELFPRAIDDKEPLKATFTEFQKDEKKSFVDYINYLFQRLEAFAEDCPLYEENKINLFSKLGNAKGIEELFGQGDQGGQWKMIQAFEAEWSNLAVDPNLSSKDATKEELATAYFADFFRRWFQLFDEDGVATIKKFFALPPKSQVQNPDALQKWSENFEAGNLDALGSLTLDYQITNEAGEITVTYPIFKSPKK